MIVWKNRGRNDGLNVAASQLVRLIFPAASTEKPAGVCSQELADMIRKADRCEPKNTKNAEARYKRFETRDLPNARIAKKPSSRVKATIDSIAS